MKKIILICLILAINNAFSTGHVFSFLRHNPPPPPRVETRSDQVSMRYFTQKLDHFNSEDHRTWSQKYFVSTEFFDNSTNNVAFLMIGGESEAPEGWMTYGSWVASARNYGALIFQLEHRFYGDSVPFPDLATENLRYLSTEQALADAANFIQSMNEKHSLASDVKWIVFGGSYSGSLAAWMRLKYPELVYGASAASAPLLAKLDFSEYYQVVIDDLAATNEQCVSSLKSATSQIENLISNPTSEENVTKLFNLCEPIEELESDDFSIGYFFEALAIPFAYTAQYNGYLSYNLDDLCDIMIDGSKKEIYRLSDVTKMVLGSDVCMDCNYKAAVEFLKDTRIDGMARPWIYQTCTEFGWFQTTNREDRVFGRGNPVDMYTSLCADVFGPEFNITFINSQINRTNADYGATNISVSKVVYVHGSYDPWHTIGLLETTNPESPVIYIEGTSHGANMYEPTVDDLPQLTAARREENRNIGEWLGFI